MGVKILVGDVFARLAEIEDESVDIIVTSPPYWGLRDYGVEGQLGLEPTLGEHLDTIVAVFRELWRVLKPWGTCWLNYGDCYATSPNGRSAADTKAAGEDDRTFRDKPFSTVGPIYSHTHDPPPGRRGGGNNPSGAIYEVQPDSRQAARRGRSGNLGNGGVNGSSLPKGRIVAARYDPNSSQVPQTKSHQGSAQIAGRIVAGGILKPKDLCMVPNRLAIALQEDGWWVRSEIVWGKLNPMPESITDRPATAHEKIWLLTKSGETTIYRARDTGAWSFAPDLTERLPDPTEKDPDRTVNRWRACDYFYDAERVRVAAASSSLGRWTDDIEAQAGSDRAHGGTKTMKAVGGPHTAAGRFRAPKPGGWAAGEGRHDTRAHNTEAGKAEAIAASAAAVGASSGRRMDGFNERWRETGGARRNSFALTTKDSAGEHGQKPQFREDREPVSYEGSRNLRNYEPAPLEVWPIASEPFKEAHFATFPTELARRCIAAGCPEGYCAKCGEPWSMRWASSYVNPGNRTTNGPRSTERRAESPGFDQRLERAVEPAGFGPSCDCGAEMRAAVCLDPFGGSGTVGLVADRLMRDAMLIELNEAYAELARKRISAESGIFADVTMDRRETSDGDQEQAG